MGKRGEGWVILQFILMTAIFVVPNSEQIGSTMRYLGLFLLIIGGIITALGLFLFIQFRTIRRINAEVRSKNELISKTLIILFP